MRAGLTLVTASACAVGLMVYLPAGRAEAALPAVTWTMHKSLTNNILTCSARAAMRKPMKDERIEAMRIAAQRVNATFSDFPDVVVVSGPKVPCQESTGSGNRRILLSTTARNVLGATLGVLVAGAVAVFLPEALIAAGASLGVTVTTPVALGVAGCIGAAAGGTVTYYLRGQNSLRELSIGAIIACAGGGAAGYLRGAILRANSAVSGSVESAVASDLRSVHSPIIGRLPELADSR